MSNTAAADSSDSLPPIWNIRTSRPAPYRDYQDVLISLRHALESGPSVAVHGEQPGSGASALALEYAFAYGHAYQVVWWIQGDSPAAAYLEALELLKALDLVEGRSSEAFYPLTDVKERLSHYSGWLLIVEDCANSDIIENLIPENPTGHIILVNPADEAIEADTTLRIAPPDLGGAVEFLATDPADDETASRHVLAGLMQSSPLLLQLISNFKSVTGKSYKTIQADLPPYLIDQQKNHLTISLRLLLSMSLEYLSDQHKASRDLLALCAFFGPDPLPLSVFTAGDGILSPRLSTAVSTDAELSKTLDPLVRLGLVTLEENSVSMHPAVQTAVREGMSDEPRKAWCNAAVNLLSESFPHEAVYREPRSLCIRLTPHVLHTCRYAEDVAAAPAAASSLYYQAGLYLHASRLLPEAADCYMRSIALVETHFGTVHPAVATRINNLGIVEHELGNLDSAQACFERAMDICERLYGPTEEAMYTQVPAEILTMPLRNLCTVLEDKGDVALAQQEYERAMKTFVDVYGWNHSVVAECAYYFGNTWMKIGQLNKAQNCYIKAVRSEENAAECDNQALADYLNSLGMVLMRQNNGALAEEQFQRALRLDQQLLGEDHIVVSRDTANLGHLYKRLDRFEEAEKCYNESLRILERNGKSNAMETALILNNLGSVLISNSHASEARTCLEQALTIITEVKGKDSTSSISVLTNLGRALDKLEAHHQALNCYDSAEMIVESREGVSLSEKATLMYRKGLTHQSLGEMDDALKYFERAQNLDTEAYDGQHPAVARDAYCVGCVLKEKGDTIVAMGHLTLALDIYEAHYGKDHPKVALVRRKLDQISNNR
jgi:tetratricopeptide (TPR) repeat protein